MESDNRGSTAAAGRLAPKRGSLPLIEALLEGGGQVLMGTVLPIKGAAIAHDGKRTLAMLRRRPGEIVPELLARLEQAIATAIATGQVIDEINVKSANETLSLAKPSLGKPRSNART